MYLPVLLRKLHLPLLFCSFAHGYLFDDQHLFEAPDFILRDSLGPMYTINYENVPYQGRMGMVQAHYSLPHNASGPVPAMVLVHGATCNADSGWVKHWVDRGYAAIAMDLNGRHVSYGRYWDAENWDAGEEMNYKDTWYYYATAAVMRANSFLRSRPEIDTTRIGVIGISWGGWLTSIVAGADTRFDLAIPVYGCGFIHENSKWITPDPITSPSYINIFDPKNHLPQATMPMLWVSGTTDCCYPADSRRKSYALTKGEYCLAERINYGHYCTQPYSHETIYAFVNSHFKSEDKLPKFTRWGWTQDSLWTEYETTRALKKAELIYATNADWSSWKQMGWSDKGAVIDTLHTRISAALPSNATVVFFVVYDEHDREVSTPHIDFSVDPPAGIRTYNRPLPVTISKQQTVPEGTPHHGVPSILFIPSNGIRQPSHRLIRIWRSDGAFIGQMQAGEVLNSAQLPKGIYVYRPVDKQAQSSVR
ncbi:MAG: prolyl oligopeptidase family serine peptidase [Chitinivibrionales bacterium]|nr:prolyl oligopeptidase family serine peptidase [Chitinivibrionales bacterium]